MAGSTEVDGARPGMETLYQEMGEKNLAPLWDIYEKLVVPEPFRAEPAFSWRWEDMSRPIQESGEKVQDELAAHRVLLMKNPGIPERVVTTTNIIAGIQCVMPGERTVEHRHTPSACRVILEGSGGGTFVDGVRCDMHDGDLILTPNWTWHNHHNDTDARTVWLDVLDVPLVGYLDAVFGQGGPSNDYPSNLATLPDTVFAVGGLLPETGRPSENYTPRFRYPWAEVEAALQGLPREADGSRIVRYVNPADGGPVLPTLDCYVLDIAKGSGTKPARTTANAICIPIAGEGESQIGDETIAWKPRDVFTLPHWSWTSHKALSDDAQMIVISDREILKKLDLFREEVQ